MRDLGPRASQALWLHDDRSTKVVMVIGRYWSGKAFWDVFHATRAIYDEQWRKRVYTAAVDLLDSPPEEAIARRVILKAIRAP